MSDLLLSAITGEIALTAATLKTILELRAPAQQRLKIVEWGVYFDGVSSSAEPIIVELSHNSNATPATGSSLTIQKVDPSRGETIQTTAVHTVTVEDATKAVFVRKNVHPQGAYEWVAPLGGEILVGGGKRVGLQITAPAGVNAVGYFKFEE